MTAPLSPHESLARVASGEWSINRGREELQRVIEQRNPPVAIVIHCDTRADRCACIRTVKHGANHECACGHEWSGQNVAGSADHPTLGALLYAEHTGNTDHLNVARSGSAGTRPPGTPGSVPWSSQRLYRTVVRLPRKLFRRHRGPLDTRVTTRDVGDD